MRAIPPIFRALGTFAVVALASLAGAAVINLNLPANRTSSLAAAMILGSAILMIGGPIVAVFLAVSTYLRATKIPAGPSFAVAARAQRRRRITVLIVIGACTGGTMLGCGLLMALPAAFLAGGGDRLPGPNNPPDWAIFHFFVDVAVVGLLLLVGSLVAGAILLMTRGNNE